ncbi:MAG: hypothetical protein ACE145_21785 [Terriglobia bacterium]
MQRRTCLGLATNFNLREAIAEHERAVQLPGGASSEVADLVRVYALIGERQQARKVENALLSRSDREDVGPCDRALMSLGYGEADRAMIWLTKAYDARCSVLIFMKEDPRFDPLRPNPRFQELLRRMKFPP